LVLDAGCAEGFVADYLRQRKIEADFSGIDLDELALMRGFQVSPTMFKSKAAITHLPFSDEVFDMVLCTEVLEHLPNPMKALEELRRVSRRYVLLSVPHEPWFRTLNFLRGKHFQRLGNDPEHLQNWNKRQFSQFIQSQLSIITLESSFPWLIVLTQRL
jgi:ubiquinone/menaquinone biosynthesis C-methylase UbiE